MRALALDTTTEAGSVALVVDDRILLERSGDPSRTHAERLPGDMLSLLAASGVPASDVDVVGVACGPGSFTGLRVGLATVQGLAFVLDRPVVTVSALEALAHLACLDAPAVVAPWPALIAPWMDARRGEVFSALYGASGRADCNPGRLVEIEEAAVGAPEDTLARWMARTVSPRSVPVFVGDGAVRYRDVIARAFDRAALTTPPRIIPPSPLAGVIGRIAVHRAARGEAVAAGAIRPLYVRRPDAELARTDGRSGSGGPGGPGGAG